MLDLLPGFAIVTTLGITAFLYGRRVGHRLSSRAVLLAVLGGVVMICLCRVFIEERLWVARWLPFSGALTCVALSPVFACAIVGVGWERLAANADPAAGEGKAARWRRWIVSLALVGISVFASNRMFFDRRAPTLFDYRSHGWVLQTTQASCSPSSAANLLKHYGIQTNESEMVDRCFTTYRGTTRLGLYRGLKQSLRDARYEPRPFWADVDTLLTRTEPAILFVELKTDQGIDPRYTGKWGWRVGLKHVVLYLGRNPENADEVRILDPAVGQENWPIESLRLLFQGEAVELVPRELT